MLKKLIVLAITSGLAAKWYKAYANKVGKQHAGSSASALDLESRGRSTPAKF